MAASKKKKKVAKKKAVVKLEKPVLKKQHGGARENSGRKPFDPTDADRKQVEAMSGYGVPHDQIAVLVQDGISVDTLVKYFDKELTTGKAKANAKVGQTLFQKATSGDTTAAIWWTKTQMKWKEVQRHELTGANGSELFKTNPQEISDEELANIAASGSPRVTDPTKS